MLTLLEHKALSFSDGDEPVFPGLTIKKADAQWQVVAGGDVGLFPGTLGGRPELAVVLPKGAGEGGAQGCSGQGALRRFFQLWLLAQGATPSELGSEQSWAVQGELEPNQAFPYFLALAYSQVLRDLVRRDFRRSYLQVSETLTGRVRGRLQRRAHLTNVLHGRPHKMPCTWEDFTADNWDNRILKAAMARLVALGMRERLPIGMLFGPVRAAFSDVADVSIGRADLHKARLGPLSAAYRSALGLARLILIGGQPQAGTRLHDSRAEANASATWGLRVSAHDAFERFCRRVVGEAALRFHAHGFQKPNIDPLIVGIGGGSLQPDLGISRGRRYLALGDAKYKDLIRTIQDDGLAGSSEIIDLALRTGDQYQVYAYLRLEQCPEAFFMVPFWETEGPHTAVREGLQFRRSPVDGDGSHRVHVLGLNLMRSPAEVLTKAADQLVAWYQPKEEARKKTG